MPSQSVSTVGAERVFSGGTLDPLLLDQDQDLDRDQDRDQDQGLDQDACLLAWDWGCGNEETAVAAALAALWGVGGVQGGVQGGEADEEAAYQGDGFHDAEVGASLECSVEEGGCAAGQSKGPQRVSMEE